MPGKGRPFKKGQSGNPRGAPKIPMDLRRARSLTRLELERLLNRFLHMTAAELDDAGRSDKLTVIEGIVISVVREAIKDGCTKRLDFLLDRLIGKVPSEVKQDHTFNFAAMPRAEAIELGREALAFLESREEEDDD